jgi:hypothetical protein
MAATKLKIYNGALREVGERKLAALTDSVESRRVLDTVWDSEFVDEVLSAGQWNFAARSALVDIDASITPPFGYTNAFTKPTDWVRTIALSEDEYFAYPLRDYTDEAGVWYAESDPLYVKWVSNGADYGNNLANWPANFRIYVETLLASRACTRLTQNENKTEQLIKLSDRRLRKAQATDAMDEAVGRQPPGNWVLSRHGSRSGQRRAD